jgi:type I restriction enzyme S subunit
MTNGWLTDKLGEVCSFLNRGVSPRYLEHGGICVLNQKCVRDHNVSYQPSRRHDALAKRVQSDRLLQAGDVLVNSTGTGTLGRVAQLRENPPEPTTVDSHVTIVRPKPGKFYPEFFGYMLMVIEDDIKEAGEGCGGQTELARSVLAERFSVHYPESITEQRRIVDLLDRTRQGIFAAKGNAERNVENTRALFESHLDRIIARSAGIQGHRGAFRNGAIQSLDELVEAKVIQLTRGKVISQRDIRSCPGTYPVYSSAKDNDGKFGEYGRYMFDEELITWSVDGGGRLFYRPRHKFSVTNVGGVLRILDRSCLEYKYLYYVLTLRHSEVAFDWVNKAHPSVIRRLYRDIPILPLTEQRQVVEGLDSLSADTRRLQAIYEGKCAALEALNKSLLHQAFTGRL